MKFWKNLRASRGSFGSLDRNTGNSRQNTSGKTKTKASNNKVKSEIKREPEDSIYEAFGLNTPISRSSYGTTFVELIKRHGTKLGVVVSGSVIEEGVEPRIAELMEVTLHFDLTTCTLAIWVNKA